MVCPHLDYYIYLWQSYLRKNKNVKKVQREVTKIARGTDLLHLSQELAVFSKIQHISPKSNRHSKAIELGVAAECELKIITVSKMKESGQIRKSISHLRISQTGNNFCSRN